MHLPRIRFRVRTLLILVGVAALAFGYWRRYEFCHRRAAWYAIKEREARNGFISVSQLANALTRIRSRSETRDIWLDRNLTEYRRQLPDREATMVRYGRLTRDWLRAAAFPWLPVPPDPLEPE